MNLIEKNKNNSILSATQPKDPILNVKSKTVEKLNLKQKQKKKIKIYLDDDKLYVEHVTAFALKLINTRAVMLDEAKMVEISNDIHNKLKNNDEIEIEYVNIIKRKKIKVYYDGSNYSIDNGAAYSMGFMTDEEFYNITTKNYYISDDILNKLKNDFDVDIIALNLKNNIENLTSKNK